MKPAMTILVVVLVVLAGCSQLARPVDQSTPTTESIEGTVSPTASQPHPSTRVDGGGGTRAGTTTVAATTTRVQTTTSAATTMSTVTATSPRTATPTAIRTPTVRATRTPTRPPTATVTSSPTTAPSPTTTPSPTVTRSPTATRTTTPKRGRLTLTSVGAENETVTLRNAGGRRLDLSGYVVDFDDGQRYTIPRYVLRRGRTVTIHTGRGDDTRTDLYAGFFYPVINHNSDTVLVETPNGRVVVGQRA